MPKIIPKKERKENLTIRIRKELIDKLRKIENYNSLVESLIEKHLQK